jgi:hypothetical protein
MESSLRVDDFSRLFGDLGAIASEVVRTGGQEFRSSGVQEFRSQEFRIQKQCSLRRELKRNLTCEAVILREAQSTIDRFCPPVLVVQTRALRRAVRFRIKPSTPNGGRTNSCQ